MWLIWWNIIKEISLENCIICFQVFPFSLVLHISEMRIEIKVEAFLWRQSSKCFISFNLMCWSQLHWAVWNNMAIVLNSPHMIIQPINLFQVNADDQRFGVLLLGRCKFILFSGQFLSSFFSFFFWIWLYLNFLVDQFGITCEEFVC